MYLEKNIWGVDSRLWFRTITEKINIYHTISQHFINNLNLRGKEIISDSQQQVYFSSSVALLLVIMVFALLIVVSRNISSSFIERERAMKQAKIAAKMKAEFLANMSHEIRTPINGVLGMLNLLLNSNLSSEQKHKALLAQSSAQSLLHLINDILDFSKVDAGKIELENVDFNLIEELGTLVESMAYSAQQKNIEIILDTTEIKQTRVIGDVARIKQILSNLLSNAIKFTQQGEILIETSLRPINNSSLNFSCSVSDTGIGIPNDKIATLFDEFIQVDASTTRKFGGTGLGLAITKKLVELMGGNIEVSSQLGHGTKFSFECVLTPSEQSKKVEPLIALENLKILVIDSNDSSRNAIQKQFKDWGIFCDQCSSIKSATNLLNREEAAYDAILVDASQNEKQAIEIAEKTKETSQEQKSLLVYMTNIDHQHNEEYFTNLGVDYHFFKPGLSKDLYQLLCILTKNSKPIELGTQFEANLNPLTNIHSQDSEPSFIDLKLLLVEDNPINQEVAVGILEQIGVNKANIDIAGNGEEALACLKQTQDSNTFDLVLLDCQMPIMDGYTTSQNIRNGVAGNLVKDIPIIAMTANAMKGDREKCIASGMNDYISKPVEPSELKSKIVQWGLYLGKEESENTQNTDKSGANSSLTV